MITTQSAPTARITDRLRSAISLWPKTTHPRSSR